MVEKADSDNESLRVDITWDISDLVTETHLGIHRAYAQIAANSFQRMRKLHTLFQTEEAPEAFLKSDEGPSAAHQWFAAVYADATEAALISIVFAAMTLEAFVSYYARKRAITLPEEGQERRWRAATNDQLSRDIYRAIERVASMRNRLVHYEPRPLNAQRAFREAMDKANAAAQPFMESDLQQASLVAMEKWAETMNRYFQRSHPAQYDLFKKAESAMATLGMVASELPAVDQEIVPENFVVPAAPFANESPPWL